MLTRRDYVFIIHWKTGKNTVFAKDPVTFFCALSFVLSLSCLTLVSVRLVTDSKIPTLGHHTAKGSPGHRRCTEVSGLSIYLCTEENKAQEDFSEHYKFLVEMDPTRPGGLPRLFTYH